MLWNPYGNDSMGYKNFICIENGVIEDPITLKGGEVCMFACVSGCVRRRLCLGLVS